MSASYLPNQQQTPSNVFGKFRLIAELGRGGMSEVYLAVVAGPAGFNKLVVIKLIKADLAEDPDFIGMFLEEARLSARLNHPNIVQTNEVGQFEGRYYIAMEYLEGQPYSRIVNRLGRDRGLPLGMGLRIMSDVLGGLQYAHDLLDFDGSALGVVHRDVTPHNVFITYDGQVKVVDFGIAKAMNSSHETRTGMLKGKVGYMAPEQARGERVDRRADIFSVGVMLWEAAVGRRLWKGMSEIQVLHQLLSGEIPRPRSMRADVSARLDDVIMKALSPTREARFGSASELQLELEDLMDAGSERTTLREVGRRVSSHFEEERQKLKQIIESQLAKSSLLATGLYQQVELPVYDVASHLTGEAHAYGPNSFRQSGPQSVRPDHSPLPTVAGPTAQTGTGMTPSYAQHSHSQSFSSPGTNSGAYSPMASGSIPAAHSGGHQPSSYSHPNTGSIAHASLSSPSLARPPQPDAASSRLTLVALAVALAAGGLIALLYLSVGKTERQALPAATGTASEPTATNVSAPSARATEEASTEGAKTVTIKIAARPRDAEVELDGEKVAGNEVTLPRDGKEHELRVSSPGYQSKTKKFTANGDLMWDPELAPEGKVRGQTGIKKNPPDPSDDGRMKVTPTSRPIDTGYPGG